jgi:hypothetical protein
MAQAHTKQIPRTPMADGFEQTRALLRDAIESIRYSVLGSRRTMAEAREAIARADNILARRISDGRKD